jgi:hypothetical protein
MSLFYNGGPRARCGPRVASWQPLLQNTAVLICEVPITRFSYEISHVRQLVSRVRTDEPCITFEVPLTNPPSPARPLPRTNFFPSSLHCVAGGILCAAFCLNAPVSEVWSVSV